MAKNRLSARRSRERKRLAQEKEQERKVSAWEAKAQERAKREAQEKQAKREALVRGRTGGEGNGGADDTRCAPSSIARGSSSA